MTRLHWHVGLVLLAASAGCVDEGDVAVDHNESAIEGAAGGKHFFDEAFPHTNGRSCATCHIEADHFGLTPQHVASLPADAPLFKRIDADDPMAAVPTYDHVRAGLIRVVIPLAANLDVVDLAGNVVTPPDRTVFVWRSVPTIENTAYTGPYQLDGRAATLEAQANGALHGHSEIAEEPAAAKLALIASFERATFSSVGAAAVAQRIDAGQAAGALDLPLQPGSDAAAGQVVFGQICGQCHGTATTHFTESQTVFDSFFPVQHADGTIDIDYILPTGVAVTSHFITGVSREHMGTLGISAIGALGQLGALPNPSGLSFPTYRIRFYTDATRTQVVRDMPPLPPGIGPSLVPLPFSIDPGRALVSGDPIDWEGFDVPQLRGISRTAPYFHDNSAPNLAVLVDIYSRFILPVDPVLGLPPVFPPEGPGLPPESISPTQKQQLLAFLQLL